MAKPFLRYLPARLKPLSAPAVWVPLTIFTLLSILIWEYYRNPDWLNRTPTLNANPDSTLTPDEQAKLSEIDTVDLLLEGARVPGAKPNPENSAVLDPVNLDVNLDAEAADVNRRLAGKNDPFADAAAEYEFPGANRANASGTQGSVVQSTSPNGANGTNSSNPNSFSFGSAPNSPPLPTASSALSDAIDRQQALKAAQNNSAPAINAPNPNVGSAPSQTPSSGNSTQIPGQAPGTISAPYIRTTPNMSPPTGTTGYRAPATSNLPTFNQVPSQTTSNPFNRPAVPSSSGQINSGQIGTVQTSPIARPIQSNQIPASGTVYTAPRATQPEQNRQAR